MLTATSNQGVLLQASCPPGPPSQILLTSSENGQISCPSLDAVGYDETINALNVELKANLHRALFERLCAEARQPVPQHMFVVKQQLNSLLQLDIRVGGLTTISLTDSSEINVTQQGDQTHRWLRSA